MPAMASANDFPGLDLERCKDSSAGTSKPSTHGHFKIGQLVAHRLELSSNYSRLNKGPRLAFSDQHRGLPR